MRVMLEVRLERDEFGLHGAFYGWASRRNDDRDSGNYPLVFGASDYAFPQVLELPTTVNVQIAAFAHELHAFLSDEKYYASNFTAESFVASGLFRRGGDVDQS
jgi:hypothetical protein